ncbi:Trp biosynthesis-associated membrane protein [Glutamicibacter uratoxydans]|uniref:Trp biosynthesis-associated membrane protein n=1 Tax=Glutamicibacter uratoxydans TaxID=43667 RepID=UPI003D6E80B8
MRKLLSLRNVALFGVAAALLGLWAATRTWVVVTVEATTVQMPQIVVDGSQAAPAVTALCVVVLAGALALLIGRKVARYVIGGVNLLAGGGVLAAGLTAFLDPQAAAAGAVAEATGLREITGSYVANSWPMVVIVAGVLIIVQGLAVLFAAGNWVKNTKYDRVTEQKNATNRPAATRDSISDWEQLSSGEDPTGAER